MTTRGAFVAAAVAGLFAQGTPLVASAKESGKIHCEGGNSCKGKGSCKSAKNDCSGKNGCKGQGWVETTEKDCKAKGGKVVSSAM